MLIGVFSECLRGVQAFERNSTDLCTTINGFYGDLRGEPRLVAFEYTVTLSEDTTEEEFVENLLPGLEESINDAVVPTLFNCERKMKNQFRRSLQGSVLSGFSARPDDIMSTNVTCEEVNCLGMVGFVTFYFPSAEKVDLSIAEMFYIALREAMKNGDLADTQILGIRYVADVAEEDIPPYIQIADVPANSTDDEISPPANDVIDVPSDISNDDIQVEIIAPVVAGGTLLCCLLSYWALRRRRQRSARSEGKKSVADEEEKEPENQQSAITNAEPMNVSVDDSIWYTAGGDSVASSSVQSTTSTRS